MSFAKFLRTTFLKEHLQAAATDVPSSRFGAFNASSEHISRNTLHIDLVLFSFLL